MSTNFSGRRSGDVVFWATTLAAESKAKPSVAVAHVKGKKQQQTCSRLPRRVPPPERYSCASKSPWLPAPGRSKNRHRDCTRSNCLLPPHALPSLAHWQRTGSVHLQCSMPTLFPMPFLSRLTSDHHHHALEGPQDSSTTKKRAHEQRAFEERHKEPKRPRLGTQILSSRPKLFTNGLLSPVKSVASSAVADRAPGHDTAPAKTGVPKAPNTAVKKQGKRAAAATSQTTDTRAGRRDTTHESKSRVKIETNEPDRQRDRKLGEDKRSLRSHDGGTRARSELAQYFPNWDEIISDEPLPQDPITPRTRLHISDEAIKTPSTPSRARQVILPAPPTPCTPSSPIAPLASPSGARGLIPAPSSRPVAAVPTASNVVGPPPEQTFTRVSFSSQVSKLPRNSSNDPLSEEHYKLAHQRGERQEKQLRNIEKEKAQHEKVQLERLYEGLLGRDWLRQMGISGVTDGEKREKWEVKRDYVISEVKTMLDKFDRYREEEKRLKMEKEASMKENEESEHELGEHEEDEEEDGEEGPNEGQHDEEQDGVPDTEAEDDEQNLHEADHRKRRRRLGTKPSTGKAVRRISTAEDQANAAAKQLLIETLSSPHNIVRPNPPSPLNLEDAKPNNLGGDSKHRRITSMSSRTGIDVTPTVSYSPAGIDRPFTSFFAKPHLRAAAIAGHRRGRARFAFGHPVPELEEQEFCLPADWVTDDSRRDAARLRRMRRRGKKMDSA